MVKITPLSEISVDENLYGARIRQLRERRMMSQRELAKRAGTSQSAIARIEAAAIDPRVSTLERIAEVLDSVVIVVRKDDARGIADVW